MTGFRTQQPLAEYALELVMCALLCTLLHSAACVLSDIFDHDLDRKGIQYASFVCIILATATDIFYF